MTSVDVISIGLAILSIVLTITFYLKSRRLRKLSYCSRSFPLITNRLTSVPGLEVSFRGQALRDLTASRILLLNTGNEILEPADFAGGEPLGLALSDVEASFLLVEVIEESRKANAIKVVGKGSEKRSLALEFDHLGPEEGCVITVLHTSARANDPIVQGALKGGDLVRASLAQRFRPRRPIQRANRLIMWGAFLTAFAVLSRTIISYSGYNGSAVTPLNVLFTITILSTTVLIICASFIYLTAGGVLELEAALSSFGREFSWGDFEGRMAANTADQADS